METQKIEQKDVEKISSTTVVSPGSKVVSKGKKSKSVKKGKTEKKGFVATAQARLERLEKREKALTAIIETRQKTIAKMQKNLDFFKTALEKVKKQKESELTAIKELSAIFSTPKA